MIVVDVSVHADSIAERVLVGGREPGEKSERFLVDQTMLRGKPRRLKETVKANYCMLADKEDSSTTRRLVFTFNGGLISSIER